MLCVEGESNFLVIYSCLSLLLMLAKSSCQIRFIENVFVPDAVTAEIVLIPLAHFLVNEILS
jgi:hypothetical protein